MAISLPAAITGGAQTGLTLPVYNTTADIAPDTNAKQVAVTSLGGTQTGVDATSVARPFTLTYFRPKVFKVLGKANPTTGVISSVPLNHHKIVVRKGVTPLAGQPSVVFPITIDLGIPAGSDTADPANLRAAISAAIGLLNSISAGLGDTVVSGVA